MENHNFESFSIAILDDQRVNPHVHPSQHFLIISNKFPWYLHSPTQKHICTIISHDIPIVTSWFSMIYPLNPCKSKQNTQKATINPYKYPTVPINPIIFLYQSPKNHQKPLIKSPETTRIDNPPASAGVSAESWCAEGAGGGESWGTCTWRDGDVARPAGWGIYIYKQYKY